MKRPSMGSSIGWLYYASLANAAWFYGELPELELVVDPQ